MASLMRLGKELPATGRAIWARLASADRHGLRSFREKLQPDESQSLSSLIESEIIPRLMLAHAPLGSAEHVTNAMVDADDVIALAPLALEIDADALLMHVEAILDRGVSVEAVLVDLLAPTARLLGEFWEEDRCDFVDVTMGLWRLQEIVHEITARAPPQGFDPASLLRVLFASMPGDQHDFGTVVIEEVFRRKGWETDRMSGATTSELLKHAAENWFDMIGLTISCDCHIAPATSIIAALRNVSSNPNLCIMVGGRVFVADPDLVAQIGADGTASDANLAQVAARNLVRDRVQEFAVHR